MPRDEGQTVALNPTSAAFLVYTVTFAELQRATRLADRRLAADIELRARQLGGDEQTAALLAVEHFRRQEPRMARPHFERVFVARA
jgi:hypothetical protein